MAGRPRGSNSMPYGLRPGMTDDQRRARRLCGLPPAREGKGAGGTNHPIRSNTCASCGALNPSASAKDAPTHCAICGSELKVRVNSGVFRWYDPE